MNTKHGQKGFTLIELSIVLVIIGLIAGGILVGREMIKAAEIRAQLSQIEKFSTAVNTFRLKYNALPGDMNGAIASQFGFLPRGRAGVFAGMGDGNGLIEGTYNSACGNCNYGISPVGEPLMFWNDLTWANGLNVSLVPGTFTSSETGYFPSTAAATPPNVGSPLIDLWLPRAAIGRGNYVYVWSLYGRNYFGVSAVYFLGGDNFSNAGLSITEAFAIDSKMDDSLPQSGSVTAMYIPTSHWDWAFNSFQANGYGGAAPGSATTGNALTCYDNAGDATQSMRYSIATGSSDNINCALSFRFQ